MRGWPSLALASIATCLLFAACPAFAASIYHPSLTVPPVGSVSQNYYQLLLNWTKTQTLGSDFLEMTYLDPTVEVAQLATEYSTLAAQKAHLASVVGTFPRTVKFQVVYQAQVQGALKLSKWKVALLTARGRSIAPISAVIASAPTYVSSGSGQAWSETVVYTFPNVNAIARGASRFGLQVSGTTGTAKAIWNLKRSQGAGAQSPFIAWINEANGIGIALSLLILGGVTLLWRTRWPKELAQ